MQDSGQDAAAGCHEEGHSSDREQDGRPSVRPAGPVEADGDQDRAEDESRGTDGVIAAAFVTAGQLGLHFNDGSSWIGHASLAVSVPVVAAMAVPLVFRRAAPFSALCLVAAAVALPRLFADVTLPLWGGLGALVFAVYSCSRHAGRPLDRHALVVPAFTLAMLSYEIRGFASWPEYSFSVPVLAVAWLIGQGLRRWERNSALLREHLDHVTATEQARAASAVADERARIARELHDVGSVKAEPQPGGGYKVQAAIPLPAPERT